MYQYFCSRCGTRYHTKIQIKSLPQCPICNPLFSKEDKKTLGLRKARTDLKSIQHKRKMNRERVRKYRKNHSINQINDTASKEKNI